MIAQQAVQALFVAWQQPDSRRYYPVARLASGVGAAHDLYEFAYVRGADEAAAVGFHPFLAFPDLHGVCRSAELFPFFTNRLMSRKRPDFLAHVERLGLDASADDMAILARSGGTRATDSIELFPLPIFDPEIGWYQTCFWMHGFRHLTPQQLARLFKLQPGEPLLPVHEPANPHDANAIGLLTEDQIHVGYVPRSLASDAVHLLKQCSTFRIFVQRVNPDPAPMQQRLLCDLQSCWPEGFVPCDQPVYQPISPQAVRLAPCDPRPSGGTIVGD